MNNKYTLLFTLSATLLGGSALAIHKSDHESASEREYKRQLAITESLKGGTNWASVGNDNNCDYRTGTTKIQDAINAGHDEIRIVEGTYAENVLIDDISVKLFGGYATCADANNNVYDNTSVDSIIDPGSGSGLPVVRIEGNSQNNQVTFRNLKIQRGEDGGGHLGAGISIKDADVDVTIRDVVIRQNFAQFGGGLYVDGGAADVNMSGVQFILNEADFWGGGVYCTGIGNKIVFDMDSDNFGSSIFQNSAGSGGGVAVANQCHFVSYVGGTAFSGILSNSASIHGGGIYAITGALVELFGNKRCYPPLGPIPAFCLGNDTEPVDVTFNRADSDNDEVGNGGGIYATGNNTEVRAFNTRVNGNSAHDGGAVFVTDGASFKTMIAQDGPGTVSFGCPNDGRCNQYINNKASEDVGQGGAFYAEAGAQLEVIATHIEGNRADLGAAFNVDGFNTDLKLEGSYVTGNGSADADGYADIIPVDIGEDADVRIEYTTIADNHADPVFPIINNHKGALRLYSSIIHEQNATIESMASYQPVYADEDCLIVSNIGDISNGSRTNVTDPNFVDRANNDYHISNTSLAIDYCNESHAQHTLQDTDQEDRGWDDYTLGNIHGPFDIGADESYSNDIIFKDGLE